MNIIKDFEAIRDIPYRIPTWLDEVDNCCNGKHKILKDIFTKNWFKVRYRICSFLWSTIDIPKEISNISHNDYSTHLYLEVYINNWVIIDATWDIGIKNLFHINNWDGKTDTQIAVRPLEIFSPEKSAEIMENENNEEILNDLSINWKFYEAFNNWLVENREFK